MVNLLFIVQGRHRSSGFSSVAYWIT